MGKSKMCELWIGTSTNFFRLGSPFPSIASCRRYINSSNITCYKEIHVIDNNGKLIKLLNH